MPSGMDGQGAWVADALIDSTPVLHGQVTFRSVTIVVAVSLSDSGSTAFPSGRAVSDVWFAESTSVIVAVGTTSTGACSVKAVVALLQVPAPFRSVTGAWLTGESGFMASRLTATKRFFIIEATNLVFRPPSKVKALALPLGTSPLALV